MSETSVKEMPEYEALKLDNQLCFPLYARARGVVRLYTPYLNELGITYTQFITLMVLWEKGDVPIKELTGRLFLDTGTMTPLLRKMEQNGLITRTRSKEDERVVMISLTDKGRALRDQAASIPAAVGSCIDLPQEEAIQLYQTLYKILKNF